jgi:hypothetical protein
MNCFIFRFFDIIEYPIYFNKNNFSSIFFPLIPGSITITRSINIEEAGKDEMAEAAAEVRALLRERHRLDRLGKPDDFTIQNQADRRVVAFYRAFLWFFLDGRALFRCLSRPQSQPAGAPSSPYAANKGVAH